ncbi:MAG TPA: hypothetical protein VLX91_02220 [Candidatus Acidoferrales bacterium]|nr:hypothetical protein [Candidatus Acidoferrales bacterium]
MKAKRLRLTTAITTLGYYIRWNSLHAALIGITWMRGGTYFWRMLAASGSALREIAEKETK